MIETEGASDLIVTVGTPPQLRVFRMLVPLNYPELTSDDTERLCMSILNKTQISRFEKEMELDIPLSIDGVGRFRLNVYRQRGYMALVARVVLESVPDFKGLGLPEIIKTFSDLPSGLVLITGPTGSGKSTTMAAMIDYINQTRPCHIVCIEDPIEVIHKPVLATVDQREVGNDTQSYAEALRRVLRQSPDVIMIGEIRDRDSAQAAITLAETGHLTLATLHTRGAISSVNRLIDMFPPQHVQQMRSQLSSSLAGVIWQQLFSSKDKTKLHLACEVMTVTPAVRALIMNGNTHEIVSLLQTGKKHGMCSMQQSIEYLRERDMILPEQGGCNVLEALLTKS
ncbi:MAG: PilT/PilU family type 4a pilus ATPase [Planctomycetes bacterium]|nr:PilT/PilU family type 4a pilus ATPase [Planctomycetota bacterium]